MSKAAVLLRASREGLDYFLDAITVPSSPEPRRFGDCADPWQREKLGPKIPALEHLAGMRPEYTGPLRFMDILARGHNKTSEEAWLSVWLCLASRNPITGYVLAADREQGRIIVDSANALLRLNPWLSQAITVQRDTISGPGGRVQVLPFDAASGMGLQGNFYIADEIVHWKREREWTTLTSGLRKRRPTVFCVLSNAGSLGSWQHNAFLEAQAGGEWRLFYRKGILASWLDLEGVARDRRLMPPSEGDRLFGNEWIDPAAEYDYLRRAECEACEDGKLFYRLRREYGVSNYVASIDYGPRRDRTALCIGHHDGRRVVVDRLECWQGHADMPVQIADCEAWIAEAQKAFAPVAWVIDPYQMEGTIQSMQRRGLPVRPFKFRGGQGNYELAQLLRQTVIDGTIAWYPGAGQLGGETLVDELAALRVKRMPYGYRFDHASQKHDDRAFALASMAQECLLHAPVTDRIE